MLEKKSEGALLQRKCFVAKLLALIGFYPKTCYNFNGKIEI